MIPIDLEKIIDLPNEMQEDAANVKVARAQVSVKLSEILSLGDRQNNLGGEIRENPDGGNQKLVDVFNGKAFIGRLYSTIVNWYTSEERVHIVDSNNKGSILLRVDPLDGCSKTTADVSIQTCLIN